MNNFERTSRPSLREKREAEKAAKRKSNQLKAVGMVAASAVASGTLGAAINNFKENDRQTRELNEAFAAEEQSQEEGVAAHEDERTRISRADDIDTPPEVIIKSEKNTN